jgi:penicillin-binding protein 1A
MKQALARVARGAAHSAQRLWQTVKRHPFLTAAALPAAVLLYALALVPFTPSIADIRKVTADEPARVLSADGKLLVSFTRTHREWTRLADISPHVVDALIATEDHRFYDHPGIDFRRLVTAAMRSITGDLQGGSTLTQQLARNLYPDEIGRAATITRKLREAITAIKIESVYSKNEILETYLNTVPFLYNAFGIEMAAHTYFDKPAARLDVVEAATLIGMLKGTTYYNPVLNPKRSLQRRNTVLAQMVKRDKLTPERFALLKAQPLRIDFERQNEALGPAPHVTRYLRSWLIEWADRTGHDIYSDGLVVRTTLDARLQDMANQAVQRQGDRLQSLADTAAGQAPKRALERLEAGFMALDPQNGHIKAWVGSRDFNKDQFDHVQQARRQPGSTFKPFVYGAAFEQGSRSTDTLMDEAVEIRVDKNNVWRPSDGREPTGQPMMLREGLAYSKNTITAQLMASVGAGRVARLAQAMGVRQSKLDEVLSLALGTSPVTLKEMVAAYGTIANGGNYLEPVLVTRIEDRKGQVLADFAPAVPEQALSKPTADLLVDILRGAVDKGTGTGIRTRFGIQADVAGKTGTTQNNTDGWFILMHPQLVAGAWVGFNDSRITMRDSWGQGAHSALPIVGDFFQQALRGKRLNGAAVFGAAREWDVPTEPLIDPDSPLAPLVDGLAGWLRRVFPVGVAPASNPAPAPNVPGGHPSNAPSAPGGVPAGTPAPAKPEPLRYPGGESIYIN